MQTALLTLGAVLAGYWMGRGTLRIAPDSAGKKARVKEEPAALEMLMGYDINTAYGIEQEDAR